MEQKKITPKSPFTLTQRVLYYITYQLSLLFGRGIRVSEDAPKDGALADATLIVVDATYSPLGCSGPTSGTVYLYLAPSWLGMCGTFDSRTADAILNALKGHFDPGLGARIQSIRHRGVTYRHQAQPAIQLRRRPDDVKVNPGHVWIQETA